MYTIETVNGAVKNQNSFLNNIGLNVDLYCRKSSYYFDFSQPLMK